MILSFCTGVCTPLFGSFHFFWSPCLLLLFTPGLSHQHEGNPHSCIPHVIKHENRNLPLKVLTGLLISSFTVFFPFCSHSLKKMEMVLGENLGKLANQVARDPLASGEFYPDDEYRLFNQIILVPLCETPVSFYQMQGSR